MFRVMMAKCVLSFLSFLHWYERDWSADHLMSAIKSVKNYIKMKQGQDTMPF